MSLAEISREAVLAAMAEHDAVGRQRFMQLQGPRRSSRYVAVHEGREYDAKALVIFAHRSVVGEEPAVADFGRKEGKLVTFFANLGFDLRNAEVLAQTVGGEGFGEIPGIPEGTTFVNRRDAFDRNVHRQLQAGISGTGATGAKSIVASGGYADDKDLGDEIIYTGHGGQDESRRQIRDQTFDDSGNAALLTSSLTGEPVRVIRGADRKSRHAPDEGLRYDGLFRVVEAWRESGKDGFQVCQFRMVKLPAETLVAAVPDVRPAVPEGNETPERSSGTVQRVVRSTKVVNYVKQLHGHYCQACGVRLVIGDRAYSEGAHIRALGRPHDGPDVAANVLCLCPNCHVLFDYGALLVTPDMKLMLNGELLGELRQHPDHLVDADHLNYHRGLHE